MTFRLAEARQTLRTRVAQSGLAPRALILTHDNPDPDSIASAVGLRRLFEADGLDVVLGLGGIIGRAENRAMVRELKIELFPIERLDVAGFPIVALVDTQPGTGNNSLPANRIAEVVIDHHPARSLGDGIFWHDVRPDRGATATIVYEYLQEAQLPLDPLVSTAFLYALKSETRDLGREAGAAEHTAYVELMSQADFSRLYAITNPKLGREHFAAVDRAIRSAVSWGELLAVNLGKLDYPDLVAEVADLMLPYDKARWVLCVGYHDGHVYLSARTDQPHATAGATMRNVVGHQGAAGGHGMIAGGRMFAAVRDEAALKKIFDELVQRLCRELRIAAAPVPLLSS